MSPSPTYCQGLSLCPNVTALQQDVGQWPYSQKWPRNMLFGGSVTKRLRLGAECAPGEITGNVRGPAYVFAALFAKQILHVFTIDDGKADDLLTFERCGKHRTRLFPANDRR